MAENRPAVPTALERRLKEEAGYRCAIPTCGETATLEMAHIEPWVKVLEHTFENMIVLCHKCHWRYDKTKEIPKASILQFKRNLSLLSHRYTQVENQLLRHFARIAAAGYRPLHYTVAIHPGMTLLYTNLLEDGLVETATGESRVVIGGIDANIFLSPTEEGSDFIERMMKAQELEQ